MPSTTGIRYPPFRAFIPSIGHLHEVIRIIAFWPTTNPATHQHDGPSQLAQPHTADQGPRWRRRSFPKPGHPKPHIQATPGCDEGIVTPWHSNAEPHDNRAMRWRLLRHATQLEYGVKCSPRVLRTSWETGPSVAPVTVKVL